MSLFDPENAAELAKQSYRLRVDNSTKERATAMAASPLLGKEGRLLEVLRDAEISFDNWRQFAEAEGKVKKLMGPFPSDCKRLTLHLKRARAIWSSMRNYGGQYEIACHGRGHPFESTEDVQIEISIMDNMLSRMLLGADVGSSKWQFSTDGRPKGTGNSGGSLLALEEFTKVIRQFWLQEISSSFGYDEGTLDQEDSRREPTSASARLIYGAAKVLDKRYDLGNVREVMTAVYLDPMPRDLCLED